MGDARTRIAEDYLRVLRLFRFHAWYGKGEIDAEGLRAAAEAKDKLKNSVGGTDRQGIAAPAGSARPGPGAAGDGGDAASCPSCCRAPCNCTGWKAWRHWMPTSLCPLMRCCAWRRLLPDGETKRRSGAPIACGCPMPTAPGWNRRWAAKRSQPQLSAQQARRLLYRLGAARFQGQSVAAMGRRAGKAPAPGACCWRWRRIGSGRALP